MLSKLMQEIVDLISLEEISQPQIIENFLSRYKDKANARSALSQILSRLHSKGLIKVRQVKTNKGLPMNMWSIVLENKS